jgi:ribosome-associated heat shock protein Hsp15
MNAPQEVRIDKWLWAVRLYKTRTLAAAACRGGHVTIGGAHVKPSRFIRIAEVITARTGDLTRTVKVTALLEQRVGPKLVGNYMEDQTPAAEYLRAEQRRQMDVPTRPKGAGRPTKRDRRQLEKIRPID